MPAAEHMPTENCQGGTATHKKSVLASGEINKTQKKCIWYYLTGCDILHALAKRTQIVLRF